MSFFRKKPVVIEAVQFTPETAKSAIHFVTCMKLVTYDDDGSPLLEIVTLEGGMKVSYGDWIIKGVQGEFYPCKPDIFEQTYDAVDDE